MEPQKSGWPLTTEERVWVLKAEYDRRPGRESNKHLPQLWPVVPSAGFWGGTSWLDTHEKLVEYVKANPGPCDVLLVGELRDSTSIRLALTAAETGHLVLATLHTASAPQALDRLVDAFPSHERDSVQALFAESLVAVLAQTLCPHRSGQGRVAAHEIMVATPAVRNLLREGKVSQLYALLQTGQSVGMQTLDQSLLRLFQSQEITLGTLKKLCKYPQNSKLIDNQA